MESIKPVLGPDLEVGKVYRLSLTSSSYIKVVRRVGDNLDLIVFNLRALDEMTIAVVSQNNLLVYPVDRLPVIDPTMVYIKGQY